MNWRLKLSNWLSNGALDRYKRDKAIAEAKLKQQEITVDRLTAQLKQSQTDIERFQAQLQISKGFQVELGETKIKLQSIQAEAQSCQQELALTKDRLETTETKRKQIEAELFESRDWLTQIQQPIEVVEVKKLLPKQEFDTLWGFGLSSPAQDTTIKGSSVAIKGWVLGKKLAVSKVQITYQQQLVIEAETGLINPAIAQRYPDISEANHSGFESTFSLVGMPSEAELVIEVILEDGKVIPLCAFVLRRLKLVSC